MKNNKYEFNVIVNGKNVTEYEHGADTFIEGRKGSTYELYFKNNTNNRLEVVFSVDGLSVIDGKTASDKSTGYIVDRYSSITVPGWKIDSRKAAQFQFQPQNDKSNTTYVELLAEEGFEVDTGNQGVIGCMVFMEKLKPQPIINCYNNYYHTINQIKKHDPYYYPCYPCYPYTPYTPYTPYGSVCYNTVGLIGNGMASSLSSASYNARGVASQKSPSINVSEIDSSFVQSNYNSNEFDMVENSIGTGFGDDTKFETVTIEFERQKNNDWFAVINYDTIQGLRKRGIFFVNSPKAKAFPNFKESEGCHIPVRR
jgi:hypothetical protein